ncbi:MAG: HEAT repeat domain-containing protein [Verrucomicrobia bacterium]|nr:HEAT repeat domain-containing protein [Verrucomicrobiota bacterium]
MTTDHLLPTLLLISGLGLHRLSAQSVPDPQVQLQGFRVLEGFAVELVASETNGVVKPIQLRFDPEGRLWVAGSVSYPQITPGVPANDRIVVLEDRDRDGRFERTTVFAEGLQIPTGIEIGDGGVYVGAATELLHLRDSDGDGRADERRVVLRGFGTGDSHQTLNSFAWGPSGELMLSQGLHAQSRVETPWGLEVLQQAGVWRFWPRTLRMDPFWSGAMGAHNPFGTVFDRWGQPFVFAGNGHGIYHLTQAMIRTDHFLEHRSVWNEGRKFGGGDVVENARWPAMSQGEFVSGGYLQNTVERFRMTEAGASFRVERLPPLVETSDTSFRIVDVRFGPDGALYLCDWSNPVIGHYQASFRDPARDKSHGRIWRVAPREGRPVASPAPGLATLPVPVLLDGLDSKDRWTRQMSRRVLASRSRDEVLAAVRQRLTVADLSEGLLFELAGVLGEWRAVDPEVIGRLAGASRFEVRGYAARLTGHLAVWRGMESAAPSWDDLLQILSGLAADPHPRVRLEAIVACSYLPDSRAVEVAALATDAPMEPALDYAFTQCVQALKPWWRPAMERGEILLGGVASRMAALTRADRSADTVSKAAGRLRRIGEVALDDASRRELLQTVTDAGGPKDLEVLLQPRTFMQGAVYDGALHAAWLERLAGAARRRGVRPEGDLGAALTPLLVSPTDAVRCGALRLAGVWRVESLHAALREAAGEAAHPDRQRAAAEGLGEFADPSDLPRLSELAVSAADPWVRAASAAALVRLDPAAAAAATALLWKEPRDPALVRAVLTPFLQQPASLDPLAAAFRTTPPSRESAAAALEWMAASGRRDPLLAEALQRVMGGGSANRVLTVAEVPALAAQVRSAGDPVRGASVFQRPSLGCTTCHSVDAGAGKIGPHLGALGTSQTVEFILGAMLEPQQEVKEGFVAFEVTTRRGDSFQGYLRGETPEEISVLDHLSGQLVRLPADQIAQRRQIGSLMPSGLLDGLSADEVRDLTAYLAGLGRR